MVKRLDGLLLLGGLALGDVVEVCGSPGSGKTQLLQQLLCQTLVQHDAANTIANDTKHWKSLVLSSGGGWPFDARRLLPKTTLSSEDGSLLCRIQVSVCIDAHALIETLRAFEVHLRSRPTERYLVAIDSVGALLSPHIGASDSTGNDMIATLDQIIQRLLQHSVIIVMTNYTVIHHGNETSRKPALGHRWAQIPNIRLLVTIPPEEVERRSRTIAPVFEGPEEDILSYQGPDGRFWPAFKRTIRRLPVVRPKIIITRWTTMLKTNPLHDGQQTAHHSLNSPFSPSMKSLKLRLESLRAASEPETFYIGATELF